MKITCSTKAIKLLRRRNMGDPMTEAEIGVKFKALGREVMGEPRCREIALVILNLEQETSVSRLLQLTTAQCASGI